MTPTEPRTDPTPVDDLRPEWERVPAMDYDEALQFLAANTKPEDAGTLGAAIRSIRATARAEGYEQARQDRAASYEDHVTGLRSSLAAAESQREALRYLEWAADGYQAVVEHPEAQSANGRRPELARLKKALAAARAALASPEEEKP